MKFGAYTLPFFSTVNKLTVLTFKSINVLSTILASSVILACNTENNLLALFQRCVIFMGLLLVISPVSIARVVNVPTRVILG